MITPEIIEHQGHILPLMPRLFGQRVQESGLGHNLLERHFSCDSRLSPSHVSLRLLPLLWKAVSEGTGLAVEKRVVGIASV